MQAGVVAKALGANMTVVCSHVRKSDGTVFTVIGKDGVFGVVEFSGSSNGPKARVAMGFHTFKGCALLFAKLLAYGMDAPATRKQAAKLPGVKA